MCGRFTLRAPASVIAEQFALFEVEPFTPRYNIAPTQPVAVVRVVADGQVGQRELAWVRWGLIPRWAKGQTIGNRLINARADSVAEKPAFRDAFRRRRSLMLADGFYEWQKTAGGKRPFFIRMRDDRPFAFAAIWESWQDPDGERVESAALLTTEPNEVVSPIHDRMPAILKPEDYERWLDPAIQKAEPLMPLLGPYTSEAMTAYPVSAYVNSPAHEDVRCIDPAAV